MPQYSISANLQNKAGALVFGRADAQGAAFSSLRHGNYYQGAYAGTSFWGGNNALATTSAGLATTYTGLCLSNPATSTVNLSINQVSFAIDVAETNPTTVGLIVGWAAGGITAHTTPGTVQSAMPGASAAAAQGLIDTACTLVGTPLWRKFLSQNIVGTNLQDAVYDIDGAILIPPGGYMAFGTSIASPASAFWGNIDWDELPL
jgi:hypothetical protein